MQRKKDLLAFLLQESVGDRTSCVSVEKKAHTVRLNDPGLFLEYAEQVWQESENYLASIPDGSILLSQRLVTLPPQGERSALEMIGHAYLSHPLTHLGEIMLLRGTMGKQGFPF